MNELTDIVYNPETGYFTGKLKHQLVENTPLSVGYAVGFGYSVDANGKDIKYTHCAIIDRKKKL